MAGWWQVQIPKGNIQLRTCVGAPLGGTLGGAAAVGGAVAGASAAGACEKKQHCGVNQSFCMRVFRCTTDAAGACDQPKTPPYHLQTSPPRISFQHAWCCSKAPATLPKLLLCCNSQVPKQLIYTAFLACKAHCDRALKLLFLACTPHVLSPSSVYWAGQVRSAAGLDLQRINWLLTGWGLRLSLLWLLTAVGTDCDATTALGAGAAAGGLAAGGVPGACAKSSYDLR